MDPVFIEIIKKLADDPASGVWVLCAMFGIRELFVWLRSRNGQARTTKAGQEAIVAGLAKIHTSLQEGSLTLAKDYNPNDFKENRKDIVATRQLVEQIHREVVR